VSEPDLKWRGYIVEVELWFLGRARGQPALSPPARGLGPHPQLVGRGLAAPPHQLGSLGSTVSSPSS